MSGVPAESGERIVATGAMLSMEAYSNTWAAVWTFGGVRVSFVPETVTR